MRILICDADASARAVTRRLLQIAAECDVDECASGPEAIERLDAGSFDALAIDVDLPVVSGLETVAILREAMHLCSLPVLVITNDRTRESVVRSKELEVTDYILKPVRMARLQAALRTIASRPRAQGTASRVAVTIDQRTRAMVVDGDESFREFLCGILAPYCAVTSATSGAFALTDATDAPPSIVFIGRDLGPVGPAPLVRYLSRLGTATFIKLAHEDEVPAERMTRLYSEVIPRTMVPAVLLKDLRRFISQRDGAMARLLEHVPDIRSVIGKTAATTFSMMLSLELDVVEPGETDLAGAHALVTMTVGGATEVRVEIQCDAALLRQAAVVALGDDTPDAHAQAGVLGEVANVLTGKVQALTVERGTSCGCSLPQFGQGAAPRDPAIDQAERMVIEMVPRGASQGLRIVLFVLDKAEVATAAEPEPERLSA